MRKPTHADAELLLHLYEMRRETELRRARQWFLTEFRAESWGDIKRRYLSHSDEDRHFRMTTSYWEMVGTLVNRGVPHPDLFFDHTGEDIVTWERCKPWIEEARADIRPTYLYQFERLVQDHLAFRAKVIAERAGSRPATNGRKAGVVPSSIRRTARPTSRARRSAGARARG